jgi:hypothetical protein
MGISSGLGLAALVVLVLLVFRGVQRRTDLLLTVASFVIAFGEVFDVNIGDWAWEKARDYKWRSRASRFFLRIERTSHRIATPFFRLGWRIEDLALGRYHYNRYRPGFGLSAASYDDDWWREDDGEYEYADDARYDY